MKSLPPRTFVLVGFVLISFAFSSYGQSSDIDSSTVPPISIEILDPTSPGCCGGSVLGRDERPDPVGARLKNVGLIPIRAYAVITDVNGRKDVRFAIYPSKPVEPGKDFTDSYVYDQSDKVSFSLDFVEFTDGSKWGNDSNEKSKLIDAYMEGWNLAIARIKKVLGEQEAAYFIRLVELIEFTSSGDPIGAPKPERVKSLKKDGYRVVVNSIRQMHTRTGEAVVVADKLEQMEEPVNK